MVCCGLTQCQLRSKALDGDMTKYSCAQGRGGCCGCIKGDDSCWEPSCPAFCACLEGHCCNCQALNASRYYTMEKYNLKSDICDHRLILCSNFMLTLACVCECAAKCTFGFCPCCLACPWLNPFQVLAWYVDLIALFIHQCVSGCMTAQVANEINYQIANPQAKVDGVVPAVPVAVETKA